MNGTAYYVVLLFLGELVEVNRIARYPDCKLRVLFGMSLRVEKRFAVEYVYVEMMSAVCHIGIEHIYKIICP